MGERAHWEAVYREKTPQEWSWYRPHLESSLAWIEEAVPDRLAPILDVGAGASTLVEDLLARGYRRLTALDLSATALALSRQRLNLHLDHHLNLHLDQRVGTGQTARVQWIAANIITAPLPTAHYALWHDRAVFHFLTTPEAQQAYRRQLARSLAPGGTALLATFALDGPTRCSGLNVCRYDAASLTAVLNAGPHAEFPPPTSQPSAFHLPVFHLEESRIEEHQTPMGHTQRFLLARFRALPQ